ncbi:hypothetical protein Dvar_00120 [Desulfosarcina variabilis str. Montpellier]|uniref:DUF3631 domain-containing protein n=1 Tax=Desulfosarcina variabilis TaxID=2300 RepID=UPI003AFA1464
MSKTSGTGPKPEDFSQILLNGKRPIEKGWERYCEEKRVLSPDQINGHNVGNATGPASGCIVLDIDDHAAFDATCNKEGWTTPNTYTVETGSGGRHLYFQYPKAGNYGNRACKAQGFDIRGTGGQVVAPGSIHPDTGKPYRIVKDIPMVPAPQWLLDLYKEVSKQATDTKNHTAGGDIDSLPIKPETKAIIKYGAAKGCRSEAIMTALNALVWSDLSDAEIISIFESYPIGEKYLEKGNARERWLQPQISKARSYVTDRATEQQTPKSDFTTRLSCALDLDSFEYERQREKIADDLGVRRSWLDEQRKIAEREQQAAGSDDVVIEDTPWNEPVDGNWLMGEIVDQFERHIVLPDGAAVTMSAWVVLTYCYDSFRVLPIIGLVSPQKRCGKTTTMTVLSGMSNRALPASNISPAAVFRAVEKFRPTLLVDEADSFLKDNEELRGILNSGHTRSTAFVIRCDGENNDPKKFSTWAPKAIAAIGQLPGTIADRAILVKLRRKTTKERREKIGERFDNHAAILRRMILRWVNDNIDSLKSGKSTLSVPGNDRATDNWAPLAAIVSTIGHEWPDKLASAARAMLEVKDEADDDLSILLLADIREAFVTIGNERIFSANLVNYLNSLDERPWSDLKSGKGLTTNVLARFLSPFGIKSKTLRIGVELKKGYELETFKDAFNRYIPSDPPKQAVTPLQTNNINKLSKKQNVTSGDTLHFKNDDNHPKSKECYAVTDQKGGAGKDIHINRDDEVLI